MYSQAQIQVILDDVRKGIPNSDVAAAHKISYKTLKKYCDRHGVKSVHKKSGPKGPRIKLVDVINLVKMGKTTREIAEALGCDPATVLRKAKLADLKPIKARRPAGLRGTLDQ